MKPILFNSEMVRAILDNRKTETRRLIKPQPEHDGNFWKMGYARWSEKISIFTPTVGHSIYNHMPYHPGDILYVRESYCPNYFDKISEYRNRNAYKAGFKREIVEDHVLPEPKWTPSIHMPKEAARIFLEVKDVRVERLHKITMDGLINEGIIPKRYSNNPCNSKCKYMSDGCRCMNEPCPIFASYMYECHIIPFEKLWDSNIKKSQLDIYGFNANPWVYVIKFERYDNKGKINL